MGIMVGKSWNSGQASIRGRGWVLALLLVFSTGQETWCQSADSKTPPSPAVQISSDKLGLEGTSPARLKLVEIALEVGQENRLEKYVFGSADPTQGGFDCSGAMYFVLRKAGLNPPRSSAGQYTWLKEAGNLVSVPETVTSIDDPVFTTLKPGDLLFWSGTYTPTDGRDVPITHVQMYLGEETDGRKVMIGSTDGRPYRGKRQVGYGVYDFRIPAKTSPSKLVGFGSPPGLNE